MLLSAAGARLGGWIKLAQLGHPHGCAVEDQRFANTYGALCGLWRLGLWSLARGNVSGPRPLAAYGGARAFVAVFSKAQSRPTKWIMSCSGNENRSNERWQMIKQCHA